MADIKKKKQHCTMLSYHITTELQKVMANALAEIIVDVNFSVTLHACPYLFVLKVLKYFEWRIKLLLDLAFAWYQELLQCVICLELWAWQATCYPILEAHFIVGGWDGRVSFMWTNAPQIHLYILWPITLQQTLAWMIKF